MHRTQQLCGPVLIATLSAVAGAEFEATYSTDFSDNPGTHYGQSFRTTHNDHRDLQLVSDGNGGFGSWHTGSESFAGKKILGFTAQFNFSTNTNGNGGVGDGFSFCFGDMTNLSGDRWQGGEGGLNAFANDGHGMSIGFDMYGGDSGIHSRWGSQNVAWNNFGPEWWEHSNEQSYDAALTDANQGHIIIEWSTEDGLVVKIDWGGDPIDGYYTSIDTEYFTWPGGYDTTDWSFGFAARNGGIDHDVLIDNLDIAYTFVPTPAALPLLGFAGLIGRRRRN